MSKRDEVLFAAQDALQRAFQDVNKAQLVCRAEGYEDDAAELENAKDATNQAIEWLKITRMVFLNGETHPPSKPVTQDDILNVIEDADMYDANASAVAASVFEMLKNRGVL